MKFGAQGIHTAPPPQKESVLPEGEASRQEESILIAAEAHHQYYTFPVEQVQLPKMAVAIPQEILDLLVPPQKQWYSAVSNFLFGKITSTNRNLITPLTQLNYASNLSNLQEALSNISQNDNNFKDFFLYLNAKSRRDAKKFLYTYALYILVGGFSIAPFTYHNGMRFQSNFEKLFHVSLYYALILAAIIVAVIVNGFFNAMMLHICGKEGKKTVREIKRKYNGFDSAISKFVAITGLIAATIAIYALGFFSNVGDYWQALGMNIGFVIIASFFSWLNGSTGFYGYYIPVQDARDSYAQSKSFSQFLINIFCTNILKILGVLLVALVSYIGISPPTFLASEYEHAQNILLSITQMSVTGSCLLFAYDLIISKSIRWPQDNVSKQGTLIFSMAVCLISGINMGDALLLHFIAKNFTTIVMGTWLAACFLFCGLFNGLASVPIALKIYDSIEIIRSQDENTGMNLLIKECEKNLYLDDTTGNLNEVISKLRNNLDAANRDSLDTIEENAFPINPDTSSIPQYNN